MNTTTEPTKASPIGKLAMGVCLSGTLLAIAIGLAARLIGEHAPYWACLLFVAFEVTALVLGIIGRKEPLGRASAIASGALLLLALLLFALFAPSVRSDGAPPSGTIETAQPKGN
jgi:hypothetical protein